jgi:hypothetical protein
VQKLSGSHRVASTDSVTEVELLFTMRGLLANIMGKMFSKIIPDLGCRRGEKPEEYLSENGRLTTVQNLQDL